MKPIIDSGHGYNTPGKRSKGFYEPNGKVKLRENEVNEAVANKWSVLMQNENIDFEFISSEWWDIGLQERVNREKALHASETYFISLHADFFDGNNRATKGRFYYYSESGKKLADYFTKYFREHSRELRSPMKANFKVLRETSSPAILYEMEYMSTESSLELLMSDRWRNETAILLHNANKEMNAK